jgi:adenylate cyclase
LGLSEHAPSRRVPPHERSAERELLSSLYRRLGPRYPLRALGVLLQLQLLVFALGVGVLALFVDMSLGEFARVLAAALVGQAVWNLGAQRLMARRLDPLIAWIAGRRDERTAAAAWEAGVSLPLEFLRFQWRSPLPYLLLPAWCAFTVWQLDLSAYAFPVLYLISLVAVVYGISLQFLASELILRPVLDDIALARGEVSGHQGRARLPLLRRLLIMLPAINITTGVLVAGLSEGGGSGLEGFALAVAAAVGVALTASLALSVLLADSVVAPIRRLRDATERLGRGDLAVRVPVVSSDETGELSGSFNTMVEGLQERERLRDAFGTFVDPDLTERVLEEGTDLAGEEVEVSLLFMDIRGFTSYSERAEARDVVARLNDLYGEVVPAILRHGGHANKFIGDGLLAVFGAPNRLPDHADRAVAAGLEIAQLVRERYRGELRVGIGVNSGRVVVGTIGGGGRLDFTVIGDAVNTAARVESATRQTDDDLLITEATRRALSTDVGGWDERPRVTLKGKEREVRLYGSRALGTAGSAQHHVT